ncbi:unnamed protein product [Brugia timori]|uniref:Transposase n=1 Tax=Brugia timori TaxID=42155 RepID=A0A0R3Q7N7_9BILA|nr:unnamed protein product [Brugia timori]
MHDSLLIDIRLRHAVLQSVKGKWQREWEGHTFSFSTRYVAFCVESLRTLGLCKAGWIP